MIVTASLVLLGAASAMFASRQPRPIAQDWVYTIDDSELAFYGHYALWGALAVALLASALVRTRWPRRVLHAIAHGGDQRAWANVCLAGVLVASGALLLRESVFLRQPIADDELTYRFEAQTLLHGRIMNPPPPEPPFYRNQFVVVGERGWYGQYPLGHPLVLAAFEVLHAGELAVPLLGFGSVLLTFAVGQRLFDRRRAWLACCLLLASPQFVLTHATQLSQPTSVFLMLLALLACVRMQDDPRLRWRLLLGAALGFGLIVRPMPGALFVAAAIASQLGQRGSHRARLRASLQLWPALPLIAAAVGLMLWVNHVESGSATVSAYQQLQGRYGWFYEHLDRIGSSLGVALLRQNFWLFGWPLSFAFVPFSRPRKAALAFWAMLAADYVYRIAVPKTVVATTGPVYVFEAVPLLALATVDGAAALRARLSQSVRDPAALLVSAVLAASCVSAVSFVPVQLGVIATGCNARTRVYRLLEQAHATRALVFADQLVSPERALTWALYPPNPSPSLEDELIFVRVPAGPEPVRTAIAFWKRHYADRRAFAFVDALGGPHILELNAHTPAP
jgi:hypothetical protein